MSKKYFDSSLKTSTIATSFSPQNFSSTITNSKSASYKPILYYSSDDYKKIIYLRKRSPLLRMLKVKEEFDPVAPLMKIRILKKMFSHGNHRKNLKYLKILSILQLSNTNLVTLLYLCRQAESIVINSSLISWDQTWRSSLEFTKLRYVINKLTKRIEISHNDDGLTYVRKLLMLLRICKLKNIRGISHINKSPIVMWPKSKFQKLLPYISRISEIVAEMPWLNEFYFSPMTLFCQNIETYVSSLTKIKHLEKTGFPIFCNFWWADDEGYGEILKAYFNSPITVKFLTHVTIDISFIQSVKLLNRILSESYSLKSLNLTYLALDDDEDFSDKFHQALGKLKDLNFLENLSLCPLPLKKEHEEDVLRFPINHFSNLRILKSLSFVNTCRIDLDMIELFPVLETLPNLNKLIVTGTMDYPFLIPFDKFNLLIPRKLTILHLNIDYPKNTLTVDERFVIWMNMNDSLRELELGIATKQDLHPKLHPKQLEYLCKGVGKLERLQYLKFCVGSAVASDVSILEGFEDSETHNIISNHLKKLLQLKQVILRIGSGYLTDGELKRIIAWIKNCSKLQNLALELNLKDISEKTHSEFIQFVEYSKVHMLLNSFLIKTHQSLGQKREELNRRLNQFYHENIKYSYLDFF